MSNESLGYAHYRFGHILAKSLNKKSKQLAKPSKCVANLEGVAQNLEFINGHFFANYMKINHKTEVPTVILRCFKCLNLNWMQ